MFKLSALSRVDKRLLIKMRYEKTFLNFTDILKGLSIGCFVASIVGFFLQHITKSWILVLFGSIFLIMTILFSAIYDKLKKVR